MAEAAGAGLPLIGVDFGTTNSVVAVQQADGLVRTLTFPSGGTMADVFRTVLCFWRQGTALRHAAGPHAVSAYLDDPEDSRLIMSMKTYLAQPSFMQTLVHGRPFTLERLVATFLRALLEGPQLAGARIIAGRPVRFAGERADDALGEARLRSSFREAGLGEVELAFEPEAAGFRFTRTLDGPATVLIGDFGGGTSDFSLLRFDPAAERPVRALATVGVAVAGDSFDRRIIDRMVAPHLGKDDTYRIMGKDMPIPAEYYAGLSRWHRLSLMRTPRVLREIAETARTASVPGRLQALIGLIEQELGYPLYQAVAGVKAALSGETEARLRFVEGPVAIDEVVTRADFESWIAPELAQLSATVDRALCEAGLEAGEVDRVFLTGGTSFVPAVRGLFERRFGAERVSGGGEFVSVAEGLVAIGAARRMGGDGGGA